MAENKKILADTIELALSIRENTEDKIKIKSILINILQLIEHNMYRETSYHDQMQIIKEEDDFDLRGELAPKTDRVKNLSSRTDALLRSYSSEQELPFKFRTTK